MSARTTMNEVIQSHNVVHLATIDSTGDPCVRVLVYAAGEVDNVLYLLTHKESRKVTQIRRHPRVGFAIDRDAQSREEIAKSKYIKGKGTAVIIKDQDEMQKAMRALTARFPYLAEQPGDPADFVSIRLTLQEVIVSDHTLSFGHTDEVNFQY